MDSNDSGAVVGEIQQLLDQCSPQEIENILAAIETNGPEIGTSYGLQDSIDNRLPDTIDGAEVLNLEAAPSAPAHVPPVAEQAAAAAPLAPVPPAAPPPSHGRRPQPAARKAEVSGASGEALPPTDAISVDELKSLLDQHSASILTEVKKLLPSEAPKKDVTANGIDMEMLARVLNERDREVQELERQLADLQTELAKKDQRVLDLGGELDAAVREVRHKQLDLEFQQLKLEERVRNNTELEQAQRMLAAKVEEASLNAKHAALDAEVSRNAGVGSQGGSSSVRVQGSLPWTLRKNRFGAIGI
eukprot:TRINITY_DN6766_c0_g2_i1.p1 TRINITY_DN6766_c0_g2~~TRINITY_DN6766_c0_g2_i1.p1  ORF type:complete len:303 (+),score=103.32 TRINITY_DN6766_c0_g2_i1:133-1041(+)